MLNQWLLFVGIFIVAVLITQASSNHEYQLDLENIIKQLINNNNVVIKNRDLDAQVDQNEHLFRHPGEKTQVTYVEKEANNADNSDIFRQNNQEVLNKILEQHWQDRKHKKKANRLSKSQPKIYPSYFENEPPLFKKQLNHNNNENLVKEPVVYILMDKSLLKLSDTMAPVSKDLNNKVSQKSFKGFNFHHSNPNYNYANRRGADSNEESVEMEHKPKPKRQRGPIGGRTAIPFVRNRGNIFEDEKH